MKILRAVAFLLLSGLSGLAGLAGLAGTASAGSGIEYLTSEPASMLDVGILLLSQHVSARVTPPEGALFLETDVRYDPLKNQIKISTGSAENSMEYDRERAEGFCEDILYAMKLAFSVDPDTGKAMTLDGNSDAHKFFTHARAGAVGAPEGLAGEVDRAIRLHAYVPYKSAPFVERGTRFVVCESGLLGKKVYYSK